MDILSSLTLRHEYFLAQEIFGMRKFWHRNILARRHYSRPGLRHWDISAQEYFETWTFRHCEVLAPYKAIWTFRHSHFGSQMCYCAEISICWNVSVPICPCAKTVPCRNIQVQKCPCADKSLWGKVHMPGSLLAETTIETNCTHAEMFLPSCKKEGKRVKISDERKFNSFWSFIY